MENVSHINQTHTTNPCLKCAAVARSTLASHLSLMLPARSRPYATSIIPRSIRVRDSSLHFHSALCALQNMKYSVGRCANLGHTLRVCAEASAPQCISVALPECTGLKVSRSAAPWRVLPLQMLKSSMRLAWAHTCLNCGQPSTSDSRTRGRAAVAPGQAEVTVILLDVI